ncbi:diacylglycerol O-acyltransferase 3 [Argentina anserina]|uniref:diacylglycerol O-acyltransferase 3 n=1 Tax=Argentina anserina TaxID=57926 RepID=UPI00217667F0|nr:diacylglycerol O-acyltransferase 3 [Potentilla anserina]
MEVSGLVSRQIPYYSGTGTHARTSKDSFSGDVHFPGRNEYGVSLRSRRVDVNSGFCDMWHVGYYYSGPRCGGGSKKEKEIKKKKLKSVKGLSELSASSQIRTGLDPGEGLGSQAPEKLISEGAEALLQQLEQLRAQEKELKKKNKELKARLKVERMKTMKDCDSSSSLSSSESSESECGEVIDMNSLRGEILAQPILEGLQPSAQEGVALLTHPSLVSTIQENRSCNGTSTSCGSDDSVGPNNNASSSSIMEASVATEIEVCMGKKCKTSGGVELLEEFERLMGVQGSVVGCKCMGKCKNGPNVRVLNSVDGIESEEGIEDSVRNPTNPLYIGVGLEDVSLIVASLMGETNKDLGLASAT